MSTESMNALSKFPTLLPGRRLLTALTALFVIVAQIIAQSTQVSPRAPKDDADLKYWLENMVWYHGYTTEEIRLATSLEAPEIEAALERFNITPSTRPKRAADNPLLVRPYPGGRHPRIGFLDGAIDPQRETKFSVFTPWDDTSYVVVDLPEALWSNLGLTYLAHTHIPTIFDKQGIKLPALEWNRQGNGALTLSRELPNGIRYAATVTPGRDGVRMELLLTNSTPAMLSDLRVQMCVMLKAAAGFNAQTNDNKIFSTPFVAVHNDVGNRWIISAWESCNHPWGNESVPCLHSDPKFPDCATGQSKRLRGWLSFYEGDDVQAEFARIEKLGWLAPSPAQPGSGTAQ